MIINLTQHTATPEQVEAGVFEPRDGAAVRALLSFDNIPDAKELASRAAKLAEIAARSGAVAAMIGGAPYFMAPLERALIKLGIEPLYAFSRRESVEETAADGSVRKVAVFKHLGFVGVRIDTRQSLSEAIRERNWVVRENSRALADMLPCELRISREGHHDVLCDGDIVVRRRRTWYHMGGQYCPDPSDTWSEEVIPAEQSAFADLFRNKLAILVGTANERDRQERRA